MCVRHMLASSSASTSSSSAAAASTKHVRVLHAAPVLEAVPALACTLIGWLLEYPFVYTLVRATELDALRALVVEPGAPLSACAHRAASADATCDADFTEWWSSHGVCVAGECARTLSNDADTDRRHALHGASAALITIQCVRSLTSATRVPAPIRRLGGATNAFAALECGSDEDNNEIGGSGNVKVVACIDGAAAADIVVTDFSFSLPLALARAACAAALPELECAPRKLSHCDSHDCSGSGDSGDGDGWLERFARSLERVLRGRVAASALELHLCAVVTTISLENVAL